MFTGLIEEVGEILQVAVIPDGKRIRVRGPITAPKLARGASVAVNGVCQTVSTLVGDDAFEVIAVGETLKRTTLNGLGAGARVNLECPLCLGDRLGGHWVQGHVDATAAILDLRRQGHDRSVRVELPDGIGGYIVEKGSIAVDGVSLTVGRLDEGAFTVHIIPETWERTLFRTYRPGERVNLEADILAKYVERSLRFWRLAPAGNDQARLVWESWNEEGGHAEAR